VAEAVAVRARIALLIALAGLVAAAEPVVTMSAAPASVAVGDPVELTVRYEWPADWTPSPEPDPLATLGQLFVTAVPPVERSDGADGSRRIQRITIGAERSGAWTLPTVSAVFRGPDGTERTFTSPAVTLQVGSESAPPRLPEPLPALTRPTVGAATDRRWWWIASAVVLALGLALALWRWRRTTAVADLDPHQRCTEALAAALRSSDGKAAAAGLGLALRTWIGALQGFDGAGATVREVAAVLRARPACPGDEARTLVRLLERLDEGRWHPGDLPQAMVLPLADEARQFVAAVAARLAQAAAADPAESGS
jgi:hypothetical protein